jgi:hypothetical protein
MLVLHPLPHRLRHRVIRWKTGEIFGSMVENGLKPLRTLAFELKAEGHDVDRVTLAKILAPLGITPKRMSNASAKGLDEDDQNRVRRFFRSGVRALR